MYLYTRRPLKLPIVLLLKQSIGNIRSFLDLSLTSRVYFPGSSRGLISTWAVKRRGKRSLLRRESKTSYQLFTRYICTYYVVVRSGKYFYKEQNFRFESHPRSNLGRIFTGAFKWNLISHQSNFFGAYTATQKRCPNYRGLLLNSTQILTPFLLRRLKTDVEFSLPPKKEVVVYAPLTLVQQKYYSSLLDRTIMEMVGGKKLIHGTKPFLSKPVTFGYKIVKYSPSCVL